MSDLPDTENGDKGSYAAPALEKGLDILELLAEVGEPLSTREIAERLARSKSEIFRMVFVLQQRGYLAREAGTDRLDLSRRLFDLGIRTPAGRQLTSIVLPVMERFSEASGQVAHLVVLSRAQTVVLATTSGHLDASVIVRPGYGRPALDANSGLLILAFQSETRRRQLMREASDADKQRLEAAATERSFAERSRAPRRRQPRHHGGDRYRLSGDRPGRLCGSRDPGALSPAAWHRDGRGGDPQGAQGELCGGRLAIVAIAASFGGKDTPQANL